MKTQLKAALNVMFIGSIFSGFMLVNPAQAVEATTVSKAKTLLYISPAEYNYSVRLLHPYYDYWFTQGPIVAPIAEAALKAKEADTQLCTANETADEIIRVKPSLFYNPQLRVFHSKLVATVYAGNGNQLATYTGEGQQQGFMAVDHAITMHLNKAYQAAMDDLMTKLAKRELTPQVTSASQYLPCGLIGAQAEPRVSFY